MLGFGEKGGCNNGGRTRARKYAQSWAMHRSIDWNPHFCKGDMMVSEYGHEEQVSRAGHRLERTKSGRA